MPRAAGRRGGLVVATAALCLAVAQPAATSWSAARAGQRRTLGLGGGALPQRPRGSGGAARCARQAAGAAADAVRAAAEEAVALAEGRPLRQPVSVHQVLRVPSGSPGRPPAQEVAVADLTQQVSALVEASGLQEGTVTVISRHTTTAITINEWESRLVDDVAEWLLRLAPPDDRSEQGSPGRGVQYRHNDLHLRPDSADERQRCLDNGWDIDDAAELERWRAQEPINAHSHLLCMLLGSSESIPVTGGRLVIGEWQSVMLVDVDGPRERTVGLQVVGFK